MENKKSKTTIRMKVENGDDIKINNTLTEKEKAVRKLKKYAALESYNTRIASLGLGSSSDIINSSVGNFYSPQLSTDFLEKPQNLRERRAWYRFFYNSNEYVGSAVDLHSTLPLSKIRLEKPEGQNQEQIEYVYNFFVDMCNDLKLFKTLLEISHEYHLLGNCVPGNAEVKTSKGIKRADEIKVGDLVLTNKGRYKKVLKTCRRVTDKLYQISCFGNYNKLVVTGEHPVEIINENNEFFFVKAEGLKESDYIRLSYPTEERDINSLYINGRHIKIDEDFVYIVGYWICNGLLNVGRSKKSTFWELIIDRNDEELANKIKSKLEKIFGRKSIIERSLENRLYLKLDVDVEFIKWWKDNFEDTLNSFLDKRVPEWFIKLPKKKLIHFLYGIVDSERTEIIDTKKAARIKISFASRELIENVRDISLKCGIIGAFEYITNSKYKNRDEVFNANYYALIFENRDSCLKLTKGTVRKFSKDTAFNNDSFWIKKDDKIAIKIKDIKIIKNDVLVYNFEVESDHTYSVNSYSTHNCFIYAEDHNPYELEDEKEIQELQEKGRVEAERLYKEFRIIDRDPNYKGWRKLIILPPDQVRIKKIPLSDESIIEYIPDPETRKSILSYRTYGSDFLGQEENKAISKIPKRLIQLLQESGSIPLDTDPYSGSYVYHLARKKSQYETLGVSILERCINTLLYQDKLRQAQTQIASRHMTPIRIVYSDRISEGDVQALREQVDMALVDPDYSIVANYEVHWEEMGAQGRLLELSSEYDHIENNLFAGLGVTRELLTGEGTYAGNRITLEILNTQYLLFRALLQEYVEEYLFKPVAKKKGFVEKDKYGKERLLYPKLSFTRLAIKDNDSFFDQAMQLYNKGSLSIDVILDTLNIDPIATRKKIEADLFTVNDFAFNQLISNIYTAVAQLLVERYNVAERLANYMNFEEVVTPTAQQGEMGTGGLGRFASDNSDKKSEMFNKVLKDIVSSPEFVNKIREILVSHKGDNK